MKRELTIGMAAAAILVAGLSGCSDNKKPSSSNSGTSSTTSAAASAPGGKVSIDGKDTDINNNAECATAGGNVNIAIGGDAPDVAVVLTDANPPVVKSVGLGTINGVALAFTDGGGGGNATATKNGNSYKITGTATGTDSANPTQPVSKPFEINVTCSS